MDDLIKDIKFRNPTKKIAEKIQIFIHDTLGELANILLAPLLAMIVWFILIQANLSTNMYLIAAISASVGLLTDEIISGIISFANRQALPLSTKNH
jgi:hypothetical protein